MTPRPGDMALPVPILVCDACTERRFGLQAAAFCSLLGHGPGHYCRDCREVLPAADEPDVDMAGPGR